MKKTVSQTAQQRLDKLRGTSADAKQIRDRQTYEKAGNMKRGGKK